MWVVAGVLLGIVVLLSVAGLHVGPHAHLAGAVIGGLTAVFLAAMALTGDARPLLYVLLGADVVVSAGIGALAWRGLASADAGPGSSVHAPPIAEQGVAVSALTPRGIVRVRGEAWSATSMNGDLAEGARVQVIGADGLRLEVWGEDSPALETGTPQINGVGSDTPAPDHEEGISTP